MDDVLLHPKRLNVQLEIGLLYKVGRMIRHLWYPYGSHEEN